MTGAGRSQCSLMRVELIVSAALADVDLRRVGCRVADEGQQARGADRQRRWIHAIGLGHRMEHAIGPCAVHVAVEAVLDDGDEAAVRLPGDRSDGTIDGRAGDVAGGRLAHPLDVEIVRVRAVHARADVGERAAVGRDRHLPERATRRRKRRQPAIAEGGAVDLARFLLRLGVIGGDHHERVASRRPLHIGDVPRRVRHLPNLSRCHLHDPQARRLVVLVHHARVVPVLGLLFFRVAARFGCEKCQALAVRRPLEAADGVLPVGEFRGLTAVHRQQVDLVAAIAIGQEGQRATVRRPARRRLAGVGERQPAHLFRGDDRQPDVAVAVVALRRFGDDEGDARAVG